MKVLQFGADVEVMEPEELREQVVDEIKKMARVYRSNNVVGFKFIESDAENENK